MSIQGVNKDRSESHASPGSYWNLSPSEKHITVVTLTTLTEKDNSNLPAIEPLNGCTPRATSLV